MIHYHGSPLGAESKVLPEFYVGRHALVSFAHPGDIGVIADCCQTFCIDNGAFSFWKSKTPVDWDKYIEWVRAWCRHPGFDFWLIPDDIEGTEDDNWFLMFKYGRKVPYGVPVYHLHESLEHLERMVGSYPRIAIGSSGKWRTPGTASWWARMEEVMAVCCDADGVPRTKIHGLRQLAPEIFSRLPLSSADSTNAINNAKRSKRFGMYKPPNKAQCAAVIANRVETWNSAPVWEPTSQEAFCLSYAEG